ncbi:unnamed protein product [Heterotrigona itama]|uniref:S-adenosylmethionine mitochondrial carrier protein n=1 Tax=Heterotrigona itama TaxID=395501 RepID=A0A6V7HFJ0_9HYME|nr:unnamed protein product [Heterotrigona itama]
MPDRREINLRILYHGYWGTVLRDVPFSAIQLPIWECFKKVWKSHVDRETRPIESATCGAIAGSISATLTTPLDVAKTRIMLSHRNESASKLKVPYVLKDVYRDKGFRGLFAGVGPRVTWITVGGFIFFGTYEGVKAVGTKYRLSP